MIFAGLSHLNDSLISIARGHCSLPTEGAAYQIGLSTWWCNIPLPLSLESVFAMTSQQWCHQTVGKLLGESFAVIPHLQPQGDATVHWKEIIEPLTARAAALSIYMKSTISAKYSLVQAKSNVYYNADANEIIKLWSYQRAIILQFCHKLLASLTLSHFTLILKCIVEI